LDRETDKFSVLHSIFKKLHKSEEEAAARKEKEEQRWITVAQADKFLGLGNVFGELAKATHAQTLASRRSLLKYRSIVEDTLRSYPGRLKQQKRSLSSRNKSATQLRERRKSLDRLQDKDPRQVEPDQLRRVATGVKKLEKESEEHTKVLEASMEDYERRHLTDVKRLMQQLVNADMHMHSAALESLSPLVQLVLQLDADHEIATMRDR
jgi:hypothetical protein